MYKILEEHIAAINCGPNVATDLFLFEGLTKEQLLGSKCGERSNYTTQVNDIRCTY